MSFHPSYTFSDADLVLSSKDGCKFQVHSVILRRASGFFRDLLSMQRDSKEAPTDPIQMEESQDVLKVFLDACYPDYGISISDIKSFDALRALALMFVEKYEVPAGVRAVRALFFDTRIISAFSPILLYGLANEFSWDDEAKEMSKATLDIDFQTRDSKEMLSRLHGRDVVALTELRQLRRSRALEALRITKVGYWDVHNFSTWHGACDARAHASPTFDCNAEWEAFKFYLYKELESRPSGSGLDRLSFWEHPFAQNLSKIGLCSVCKSELINSDAVYERIKEALQSDAYLQEFTTPFSRR